MSRYGGDYIYSALNVTSITDIVGTSIYEDVEVPNTDKSDETINFFRITPVSIIADEYMQISWTINCRAGTYEESNQLATLVRTELNRNFATVNSVDYFSVVTILSTLPPVNSNDVYNTPVEVILRRR